MKKIVIGAIAVIAIIALAGLGMWYFPNSPNTYAGEPESITFGTWQVDMIGLSYIGEDRGYFAENGINVTMRDYESGAKAVQGMENKEVDISGSAEYPFVIEALKNKTIRIIGCIDKFQIQYCVGRKDRGINDVSDLKGKKIGLSRGTIAEFYLGRFLNLHGIRLQDVTLIDVPTSQFADAIANGSVDALDVSNIYVDQIAERLGSDINIWPSQSDQPGYWVLAGRSDWIAGHPEAINLFLKSIGQAEQYAIDHPAEAKAIVQKRLNYTDTYMATIWPQHQFSLTLDQSLVTAMEDEARWMIKNNLTTQKTVPDFRDYIYKDGLDAVRPESVNIIG